MPGTAIMSNINLTKYEEALAALKEGDWQSAVDAAAQDIHEVDRNATRIWFRFFPLALREYVLSSDDPEETKRGMALQGDWNLADQVDSSHYFLYGARYWPEVKTAIRERAEDFTGGQVDLESEIRAVSEQLGADDSLTLGISAVGLMTYRQAGPEKFFESDGQGYTPEGILKQNPDKIVAARVSEPKRGMFGFLKTIDKEFRVIWDENDKRANFEIILDEEIASAAARDQSRNWLEGDERCIEGVIPVECRSAACGTCWVGILGGEENLTDVEALERRQMKVFGYGQKEEKKPFIRLACQAAAEGSASIVIPPWNGVFGKKVYGNVERVELEPATTSAAKLRETISDVLES